MKLLFLISAVLLSAACFGQSHQKEYDSLSRVTHKKVLGYSTRYHDRTVECIVFFYNKYGEMDQQLLYTKTLDSATIQKVYDSVARSTMQFITGYTQTYFQQRETFIITYLDKYLMERYFIWETKYN
jgi:heterodisulfide reductase subunit B